MIDWNDGTHCDECKKYREFSPGEYGCGAAYGVCKFEEKTDNNMNWDKSNDEDVKDNETTWSPLDDEMSSAWANSFRKRIQEFEQKQPLDDDMSSAWANSFRKRIQEFEQKQPLTPDDVMQRQIREDYKRRVESISKLNELMYEWQYGMPSIDEVASTVSFEMAKQYDNPHDFELVKQNVYSAVAAVLGIKNINCETDLREYKMVLQWHLKWLLQSIATGPDEFKKAYNKIMKLTELVEPIE